MFDHKRFKLDKSYRMSEISNYIQEVFDEEDTIEEKQLTESLFLNNDNVYFKKRKIHIIIS